MPIMETISIISLISGFFNQVWQRRQTNQQLQVQADGLRNQTAHQRVQRGIGGAQAAGAVISTAGNLCNASKARKQEIEIFQLQTELRELQAEEAREHGRRMQESAFNHQQRLEEQKATYQLALMRERLRLDTYPFREGPGHFGSSIRLVESQVPVGEVEAALPPPRRTRARHAAVPRHPTGPGPVPRPPARRRFAHLTTERHMDDYDYTTGDFASYDPGHAQPTFDTAAAPFEPHFGSGGYHGDYNGVADCWYSSDGYVYAPDGTRIGAS